MNEDAKKNKMSGSSIEKLIDEYREYGSKDILEAIVSKSERFIYKTIHSIKHNLDREEVKQLAYMGLLIAISRFDPEKKTKFFTYAYYCIRGEIFNHLRDNGIIKYPRWIWKLNKIFNNFVKEFHREKDRYPSLEEISEGMNISLESLNEFLQARGALYGDYSLDLCYDDNNMENMDLLKKTIKSKEYRNFSLPMEDRILLWNAIDKLKAANKRILILKYFFGMSQQEIGDIMGVSQRNVSRRLNSSIIKLRSSIS